MNNLQRACFVDGYFVSTLMCIDEQHILLILWSWNTPRASKTLYVDSVTSLTTPKMPNNTAFLKFEKQLTWNRLFLLFILFQLEKEEDESCENLSKPAQYRNNLLFQINWNEKDFQCSSISCVNTCRLIFCHNRINNINNFSSFFIIKCFFDFKAFNQNEKKTK